MFKDRQMHIANHSDQPIFVFVAPSLNFAIVDMLVGNATMGATSKGGTNINAYSAYKNLNTVETFARSIHLGVLTGKAKASESDRQNLLQFLRENARVLPPHTADQVLKIETTNPAKYLNSQGWTALFNSKSVAVFIATEDLSRVVTFESSPDDSWIFQGHNVVRAKYGTVSQPDPDSGTVYVPRGDRLHSGLWLGPGDSLRSANGKYTFVYQNDNNAVIYDTSNPAKHIPRWSTNTGGTAYRLELSHDGEVSIWSAPGQRTWVDPFTSAGHRLATHECSLVMDDDGTLRVHAYQDLDIGWTSKG